LERFFVGKKKKINWINDGPLPGEIEREGGGFAAQ
jgi:hypothetical protein